MRQGAAGQSRGRFWRKRLGGVESQSAPQPLRGAESLWGGGWRPTPQAAVIKVLGTTGGGGRGWRQGPRVVSQGQPCAGAVARVLSEGRQLPAGLHPTPQILAGHLPLQAPLVPCKGGSFAEKRSLRGSLVFPWTSGWTRPQGMSSGRPSRGRNEPVSDRKRQKQRTVTRVRSAGGAGSRRCCPGRRSSGRTGQTGWRTEAGRGSALSSGQQEGDTGPLTVPRTAGPPDAVAAQGAGYTSEGPDSLSPSLQGSPLLPHPGVSKAPS